MKIAEIKKQNGSTVYRSRVYLGIDMTTGKRIQANLTARTKTELKKKAQLAKAEFQNNGCTKKETISLTSYEEVAQLWWESYQHTVKPNTQDSVKRLLANHVIPLFGSYRLDKLTTPTIQRIVNQLALRANKREEGAFLHYDKIHALNKRILQYAVTMQIIDINPAREVILPRKIKKGRNKVKHFNNLELKQFLSYLEEANLAIYRNIYEITLYKFLLATGCRINEALALHWSDIDLHNATVNITKTLNHLGEINSPKSEASYRTIDIDPQTIEVLKVYQKKTKARSLETWSN